MMDSASSTNYPTVPRIFPYAAKTWSRQRRVIARIEHGPKGANPRYVATNLTGDGQDLYEKLYCPRGDMENKIKEHEASPRMSLPQCC